MQKHLIMFKFIQHILSSKGLYADLQLAVNMAPSL